MNIIAFHGSPRKEGNTDILLQEAIRGVSTAGHDVRLFSLNDCALRPCQNCGGCSETGACVMTDDMQEIHGAIRNADRIILASPIFFFGLSAQAKIMIDRCQPFWYEKYILHRPLQGGLHGRKGLLILVGGMTREIGVQCGGATGTAFFRTISVPEHETISFLGVDEKGAIRARPDALAKVFEAGVRLSSP